MDRIDRIGPFVYARHAPALPALEAGREVRRVVIVGGGPVGLAVALGLARHGVGSVIVEADDGVCQGSRAACISRRSLEIVDRLGALDAFVAKGLAWTGGRSFYGDTEVFGFAMPHGPHDRLPPMINLQQYHAEQYLIDAIDRCNAEAPGTIDVRWASEVTALDEHESGATVTVRNALGTYRIEADWVVACDGGQGFVRRHLGLPLQGTTYDDRYVIIDIDLPSAYPTERRAWFDPPWNRGSTVLMHKQPDDLWRIDYQLRHGESPEAALEPDRVHAFVARHLEAIGEGHLPWHVVWTSVYRAGAVTLPAYRQRRVLFAGNAAHVLPIFGVRGLNSGIDDADNLAWKLAFVVRGLAADALLYTYSDERLGAFHENARQAMRSTEFMSPPSRGFDLLREACLSLAARHPAIADLMNPRQTNAIRYRDSALSSSGDRFDAGPEAGGPLVEHPLDAMEPGGPTHLTQCLGAGFTWLVFGDAAGARAAVEAARRGAIPSSVVALAADGALADAYGADDGSVYLVRPDGHVAGRWHRPHPTTLREALAVACGHAASTDVRVAA